MEAAEDTEIAAPEQDRAGWPPREKRWPGSCSFPTCPGPVPPTARLMRCCGACVWASSGVGRLAGWGPPSALPTRTSPAGGQTGCPRTSQSAGRDYARCKVDVTACSATGPGVARGRAEPRVGSAGDCVDGCCWNTDRAWSGFLAMTPSPLPAGLLGHDRPLVPELMNRKWLPKVGTTWNLRDGH